MCRSEPSWTSENFCCNLIGRDRLRIFCASFRPITRSKNGHSWTWLFSLALEQISPFFLCVELSSNKTEGTQAKKRLNLHFPTPKFRDQNHHSHVCSPGSTQKIFDHKFLAAHIVFGDELNESTKNGLKIGSEHGEIQNFRLLTDATVHRHGFQ